MASRSLNQSDVNFITAVSQSDGLSILWPSAIFVHEQRIFGLKKKKISIFLRYNIVWIPRLSKDNPSRLHEDQLAPWVDREEPRIRPERGDTYRASGKSRRGRRVYSRRGPRRFTRWLRCEHHNDGWPGTYDRCHHNNVQQRTGWRGRGE